MIKINKQSCPSVLTQNKDKWTQELLEYYKKGERPPDSLVSKYRHADIKSAVRKDSYDKCIYCESKVTPTYSGDIEHLKPKSKYQHLTYEWTNLGYVCSKCNIAKLDKYNEALPYVNPYVEDPSNFFKALGTFIWHLPNNQRGEITEREIQLNRAELIEARKERLDLLRNLIDRYMSPQNDSLKPAFLDELKIEIADNKEYAMSTRSLVVAMIGDMN